MTNLNVYILEGIPSERNIRDFASAVAESELFEYSLSDTLPDGLHASAKQSLEKKKRNTPGSIYLILRY